MFFVYAKVQPYLEEYRQAMGAPGFLGQVQQLAESSPETRKPTSDMQAIEAARARRQAEAMAAAR